jgi:hypothetical protein
MNTHEECDCYCHKDDRIRHCAPCCDKCPFCGKNIKPFYIDEHKKNCEFKDISKNIFEKLYMCKPYSKCNTHTINNEHCPEEATHFFESNEKDVQLCDRCYKSCNIDNIIIKYKDYEIKVSIEECNGGWKQLYYSVYRLSDGLECICDFEDSEERIQDKVEELKQRIDEEEKLTKPWEK